MIYNNNLYYDNIYYYYESWKNMLIRLIIIFFGALTYYSYIYYYTSIIKYYTPVHVIFDFPIQYFIEKNILLIFTAIFFNDMLFTNEENLEKRFLADVSGDIGSIIGFLIYLEIIELNFCKLNYNLKNNIIKRGEIDYIESVFPSRNIALNNLMNDIYIDDKRTESIQY